MTQSRFATATANRRATRKSIRVRSSYRARKAESCGIVRALIVGRQNSRFGLTKQFCRLTSFKNFSPKAVSKSASETFDRRKAGRSEHSAWSSGKRRNDLHGDARRGCAGQCTARLAVAERG